ncbi:MAG: hypothetical protein ACRBHB_20070 [Arenicella sp.]
MKAEGFWGVCRYTVKKIFNMLERMKSIVKWFHDLLGTLQMVTIQIAIKIFAISKKHFSKTIYTYARSSGDMSPESFEFHHNNIH